MANSENESSVVLVYGMAQWSVTLKLPISSRVVCFGYGPGVHGVKGDNQAKLNIWVWQPKFTGVWETRIFKAVPTGEAVGEGWVHVRSALDCGFAMHLFEFVD